MRLQLPPRGQQMQTSNTAGFPRGLASYVAFIQLGGAGAKPSPPVRAGRPLILAYKSKRMFSLTLLTSYSQSTGVVRATLQLRNLGVADAQARSTHISALVTIGYWR